MNININQRKLPPPSNVIISYPRDNSHIIVTWDDVRNPDKYIVDGEIKNIYYNIYKGLSQNGIFYKMNQDNLTSNKYEDHDVNANPNISNWYKVSTTYLSKDDKFIEGNLSLPCCYMVHNTDKWFLKINERNLWILKNTGQLYDLYTRKYDGEHCERCYDEIRGRSGTNDCPVCYGTGFVGGYDPAFQIYLRLKPAENSLGISNQQFVYEDSPGAWTILNTKLMNRDILIGPTGKIYHVLSSMINQAGGYLFHQELRLKAIDMRDPLYSMKRTTLYPSL